MVSLRVDESAPVPDVLEETAGSPPRSHGVLRSRRSALVLGGFVALALVAPTVLLAAYLPRPFWYDEIWRGHFVSEPLGSLWSELSVANTPSALGWFASVRAAGDLFGWHSWALRLPGFLALPALGVAVAVLVRRFAGGAAAVFAVCWLCLNATFLDLATQLKPYTVEALVTVIVVLLWPDPAEGGARAAGVRRAAAGIVALWSVPAVFVIVPLAALDVASRGPARYRRLVAALPVVGLVAAHTLVFVGHQSAQRAGRYWDSQFLAGRDPAAAVAFVAEQFWKTITGSPPGIDRFDPSVVPGYVDLPHFLPWLAAPAILVFGAVGVAVLARRPDGRRVLAVLLGAETLMLAASAVRFWPFGPTRTNLFVVPLLVLVVVVGADHVVRAVARRAMVRSAAPLSVASAVSAVLVVLLGAGATLAGGLSGDRLLWERRDRLRGLDLMVDATVATRRLVRPGDVVVVGGRLARPGWIYAMEESTDEPREPAALPAAPADLAAGTEAPRVRRVDTVFVDPGRLDSFGQRSPLAAELAGSRRPQRLVVFVFDIEERAMAPVLATLRGAGWCAGEQWTFRLTGSVTVYDRCSG